MCCTYHKAESTFSCTVEKKKKKEKINGLTISRNSHQNSHSKYGENMKIIESKCISSFALNELQTHFSTVFHSIFYLSKLAYKYIMFNMKHQPNLTAICLSHDEVA